MKYLQKYNQIKEAQAAAMPPEYTGHIEQRWVSRVKRSVKFDIENDIKEYFSEWIEEMHWVQGPTEYSICGGDFELGNQSDYTRNPVYKEYTFNFINKKILSMNRTLETMGVLTGILERLKNDGFMFRLLNLTLGKEQKGHKCLRISIYHTDDIIPWDIVFPQEEKPDQPQVKKPVKKVLRRPGVYRVIPQIDPRIAGDRPPQQPNDPQPPRPIQPPQPPRPPVNEQ